MGDTALAGRHITSTGSLGAGIDADGKLSGTGDLSTQATNALSLTGKHLATQNIALSGAKLDLTDATTQAGGNLSATAGDIVHRNAITTANGSMDLRVAGAFDNTDGRASSGSRLSLRASTLTGDGLVRAGGDLSLALTGDYTQNAGNSFNATGNLNFSTTGSLTNDGSFTAGGDTSIDAANIINQAGGLFNSNGLTALTAIDDLINHGRIYGNDIALAGDTIINDANAVIAARDTANFGAQTIVNREHQAGRQQDRKRHRIRTQWRDLHARAGRHPHR